MSHNRHCMHCRKELDRFEDFKYDFCEDCRFGVYSLRRLIESIREMRGARLCQ